MVSIARNWKRLGVGLLGPAGPGRPGSLRSRGGPGRDVRTRCLSARTRVWCRPLWLRPWLPPLPPRRQQACLRPPATQQAPAATPTPAVTATPSPTAGPPTPQGDTPDVRPDPANWASWPVLPTVSARAVEIYRQGLASGNDPHSFSTIGDCQSETNVFLGIYDTNRYFFAKGDEYLQDDGRLL